MKTYLKRLKNHPGVGMATMFTVFGGFAGLANDSFSPVGGIIFGASVMALVCWPVVLWTARTQPLPQEQDDHE